MNEKSDVEILKDLFKDEAQVPVYTREHRVFAELMEPKTDDSSVILRGVPQDAFIVKADLFPSPDGVFASKNRECKRADFIVISEQHRCILFIELKRTTKEKRHIVQQLKGAKCLVEYCKAIVEHFWENSSFLLDYEERYICFRHTGKRIAKQTTRIDENPALHNVPDKVRMISQVSSKGIEYNKLAGKPSKQSASR